MSKQFLIELVRWFRSKKIKHVELSVHVKNEIGNETWAKYGFRSYVAKQRVEIGELRIK